MRRRGECLHRLPRRIVRQPRWEDEEAVAHTAVVCPVMDMIRLAAGAIRPGTRGGGDRVLTGVSVVRAATRQKVGDEQRGSKEPSQVGHTISRFALLSRLQPILSIHLWSDCPRADSPV